MTKQQLDDALNDAYWRIGRLRIAIMRAVGRDPYDSPPNDEVLIAELGNLRRSLIEDAPTMSVATI